MSNYRLRVNLDPGTGSEFYEFGMALDSLNAEGAVNFFRRVMKVADFSNYEISYAMMNTIFSPGGDLETMKSLCKEYDLVMEEDNFSRQSLISERDRYKKLYLDLVAKINSPGYTEEEINTMCSEETGMD
jgi:hypothetical protein